MSKPNIQKMIKEYVDKNYPEKVAYYYKELKRLRILKLKKYSNVIFLNHDLEK